MSCMHTRVNAYICQVFHIISLFAINRRVTQDREFCETFQVSTKNNVPSRWSPKSVDLRERILPVINVAQLIKAQPTTRARRANQTVLPIGVRVKQLWIPISLASFYWFKLTVGVASKIANSGRGMQNQFCEIYSSTWQLFFFLSSNFRSIMNTSYTLHNDKP